MHLFLLRHRHDTTKCAFVAARTEAIAVRRVVTP
jgi:hypothetical protein